MTENEGKKKKKIHTHAHICALIVKKYTKVKYAHKLNPKKENDIHLHDNGNEGTNFPDFLPVCHLSSSLF